MESRTMTHNGPSHLVVEHVHTVWISLGLRGLSLGVVTLTFKDCLVQMYHHCSVKGTICRKGENAQDIWNHTHSYPSTFLVERGNDDRPMSGKLHQEVKNSCTLSALAVEDSRWRIAVYKLGLCCVTYAADCPKQVPSNSQCCWCSKYKAMSIQGRYSSSLNRKEMIRKDRPY